jgi:hypothetical protein
VLVLISVPWIGVRHLMFRHREIETVAARSRQCLKASLTWAPACLVLPVN